MKTTKKTISAICVFATILASFTGCAKNEDTSEPETSSPIFVQEDEYQNDDSLNNNSKESKDNSVDVPVESNTSTPMTFKEREEDIPEISGVIAEAEVSTFNLPTDKMYNTSLKPNIPDNIIFQAELVYTEEFYTTEPQNSTYEVMPFDENTTYADICNLTNFTLVPMDGELSDETNINGRFDYYGIMHTTSNSPATYTVDNDTFDVKPTLNLELVSSDDQIITNASGLISTAKDIRVKAISAKSTSSNRPTKDQTFRTPIMVNFIVTVPNNEPYTYQVGMDWRTAISTLKNQGILPNDWKGEDFCVGNSNDHIVLKNADYTLVFAKFGNYVESISLIKN